MGTGKSDVACLAMAIKFLKTRLSYSAGILAIGLSSTAQAQCVSNSSGATPTITCSGTIAGPQNFNTSGLTIINNGTISAQSSNDIYTLNLGGYNSLTNNGTISLSYTGGTPTQNAAVIGSAANITNHGTISAAGSTGVFLVGNDTLNNTGVITSSKGAVLLDHQGNTIINSGTLTSNTGAAIRTGFSSRTSITNLAGGIINGVGAAVYVDGGTLDNAGVINGSVELGFSYLNYYDNILVTYVANGGTINGNLISSASAALVETGQGLGISGSFIAAYDTNWLVHRRSASATIKVGAPLLTGIAYEAVEAMGSNTTLTLQAASSLSSDIYVAGNGSILNTVNTTGGIYNQAVTSAATGLKLASFANSGSIGTLRVRANAISNSGTIGTISVKPEAGALIGNAVQNFANSGTIFGGANLTLITPSAAIPTAYTIANSGTITPDGNRYAIRALAYDLYSTGTPQSGLSNSGTITGNVLLQGGSYTLNNSGTITGNITTDEYSGYNDTVNMGGTFNGEVNLGAGNNTLNVTGGSAAAPIQFGQITGVNAYNQTAGFASLAGNDTFGTITLGGGRLVGLAGSVITANSITIGSGATFGSAGTVVGSLLVNGTLSPGASPGTMTVIGGVTLASGSTSLFEITPTASDKLVVYGTLVIQPGSTLAVSAPGITPGTRLRLITSNGGITGSFTSLTGITGVVRANATGIDVLAQFAPASGGGPAVQGVIDYLNSAIANETASARLLAAIPLLVDSAGAAVPSTLARLTPQPYASAMQIGAENALMVSDALRAADTGAGTGAHGYTFFQALGSWRQLPGDAARGVSAAKLNGAGFLGGLGYVWGGVSLGGFVGYVRQDQTIADLGTTTRSTGVIGGISLGVKLGCQSLSVAVMRDSSNAVTSRPLPASSLAVASYGLKSWGLSAQWQMAMALGQHWALTPHVGTVWARTERAAAQEATASVFALSVTQGRLTSGFIDGGLRVEGKGSSPWSPMLDVGLRYQVQGMSTSALAGFAGLPQTLSADGTNRERLSAMGKLGLEYTVVPGMSFFLQGIGEVAKGTSRISALAGMKALF